MNRNFFTYLVLFFQGIIIVLGQSFPVGEIGADEIPQEKIFVHYNTSLLLSGEYLYYDLFCRNTKTKDASLISKVAYVELVGEDGKSVFHHKIFLEDGRGQGDFFIPVSVASGNYKLIAYTQWMKNWNVDHFFQGNISIVNPYTSNQSVFLDSVKSSSHQDFENRSSIHNSNRKKGIRIFVNDSIFGNREKVQFTMRAKPGSIIKGDYSLSVRKIYSFDTAAMISSEDFSFSLTEEPKIQRDTLYIPEIRGNLVSGRVLPIGNKNEISNIKVAMSLPGKTYKVSVANTNENGVFYQNIDKLYPAEKAIFEVLSKNKEQYTIVIDKDSHLQYSNLSFYRFKLKTEMKGEIVKRSVHNQIENAYFSVKPDTLIATDISKPLYFKKMNFYDLDDYTRFTTVRETLIEIVNNVWSHRIADDKHKIQVRNNLYDDNIPPNAEPLIVVDGILVQDHDYLLNYDARKIKRIGVLQDKYVLGLQIFQGVVAMETIEGDFDLPQRGDFMVSKKLKKPLDRRRYYSPVYRDNLSKKERIPDYRHQLLWKPNIQIAEKETTFSFYTSDVKGEFEISIEGFNIEGSPISITEKIIVE